MSKIIKASLARFVDEDEKQKKKDTEETLKKTSYRSDLDDSGSEGEFEDFAVHQRNQKPDQSENPAEDFREAYDELVKAAEEEVSMLLSEGRQEAEQIVAAAEAEAEAIRGEAFNQGFNDGEAKAKAEAEKLLKKAKEDAKKIKDSAESEKQALIADLEPKVYKLSLEIAAKILHHELESDNETYMSILSHALSRIKSEKSVTLMVNAEQYTKVFKNKDRQTISTENGNIDAEIVVDQMVENYGVLIDTDSGMIDASVSAQLEQIAQNLGMED